MRVLCLLGRRGLFRAPLRGREGVERCRFRHRHCARAGRRVLKHGHVRPLDRSLPVQVWVRGHCLRAEQLSRVDAVQRARAVPDHARCRSPGERAQPGGLVRVRAVGRGQGAGLCVRLWVGGLRLQPQVVSVGRRPNHHWDRCGAGDPDHRHARGRGADDHGDGHGRGRGADGDRARHIGGHGAGRHVLAHLRHERRHCSDHVLAMHDAGDQHDDRLERRGFCAGRAERFDCADQRGRGDGDQLFRRGVRRNSVHDHIQRRRGQRERARAYGGRFAAHRRQP
mmetsp:Transcript_8004/g.25090  ORF Transcript_8004/g.25090 Transcript_8004/m.25090 type:complete len:282 (-) Transcript_8004:299-1144(-)